MKARLKDPDIARLFENTFPNTLGECRLHMQQPGLLGVERELQDTTVKYFNKVRRQSGCNARL